MPNSAPHACTTPGCPELVDMGNGPCEAHRRQIDRRRGSASSRGYGAWWRAYRVTYLAEHPLCVVCQAAGIITAATVVDHIVDHKGDETLLKDPNNHRAVCKPHHDERTDAGDFGRGAPIIR